MSTEGSTRAIIAALIANIGIAITKFIAAAISGSASMFAEAIHSVADSGNQVLLIVGGRRARRAATATHPFGYGRSRYIYAFIVSIVLFSVGGLFSISEGLNKLQHPHELEAAWLPLTVLGVSILLESFSLRTALREAKHVRGSQSLVQFIRHAKSPELPVVLLEDIAALVGLVFAFGGVGLTVLTHDAVWDAIGTLAIGALLVAVAVILGIETSSLLLGEGASAGDVGKIRAAIEGTSGVESIIHMKTLYLGPDELMVGAKIAIASSDGAESIVRTIDAAEVAVRAVVPAARVIYLEPDIRRV
ncbi:cation diffusion facilitator family transporter [Rhodoluna sp.]|uniref:cation diffusion facilitator family transporter n=1 Tax=Rhodoluna sp. TaxID=1969481 RepID=UPI0025CC6EDD|nr:cation diffusion facilitator family transporter [Rhodoluna sp.]